MKKMINAVFAASLYGATKSMELGPDRERAITHPAPKHLMLKEQELPLNRQMERTLGATALTDNDSFLAFDAITSHRNKSTHR